MKKYTGGIMPACMTIWNADESFNAKGQEKYVRWLLDKGANALSVCGSTGENIAMSIDEQKKIIETVCRYVDGEVPIYAGTGRYTTAQTIEITKFAADCGAEGAMIILPYYLKPHKRAVMNHFRAIHKAVDNINIMAYNNPHFAGNEFTAYEVKELFDEGTLTAIKSAHGDVNRVHDLKNTVGKDLLVMYGHDYAPMEALLCGADGWLSGLPAIFPKFCNNLYEICTVKRDADGGMKLWSRMRPFVDYFYTYYTNDPHWQEIFKYVLLQQGLDYAGLPRAPLGELLPAEKKKVDAILKEIADLL